MIRLNIDGREVIGYDGDTILAVAQRNGIEIPTLCDDPRVKPYGACGLCVVEAENNPKLMRACSTVAADGMILNTRSERVIASRKTALELLFSDHTGDCRPPCVLACPGNTDCQGYVSLVANGDFEAAYRLIKEQLPLPASIGRVCPHPCEKKCRRKLVEEPISIAAIKSFVGDRALSSGEGLDDEVEPDTGKSVGIIGGGPGGLTAAYFLRRLGHAVTVYDAMPKMGGMLRYGIPEYRLPKELLDKEISVIKDLGIEFKNNAKIGRDMTLEYIRNSHNAVVVATGAWSSMALGCPGEEKSGVVGGIDFLRAVALGDVNPLSIKGGRVAIVGGGNTAMDACRTAVRLGATEVYNIYRRTKAEMPAEAIEIQEAEEEGVIFKNLTNPIEICGTDKVESIRLQCMELGEPDQSGRRSPVPVPGKEEVLEVDIVIIAIGQIVNLAGFEELKSTGKKTLYADENSFETGTEGVFAIGDAINRGADIAIAAIGHGRKVADVVHSYLNGSITPYKKPYLCESVVTEEKFKDKEHVNRVSPCSKHLSIDERKTTFKEVGVTYTEQEAINEAMRCLECGCWDYYECKLIKYANQQPIQPQKYSGCMSKNPVTVSEYMYRNPNKCILCGLCVRICDERMGNTALGLSGRGFDTVVKPEFGRPINETDCTNCGQCVHACPTGAIGELPAYKKALPTVEKSTRTTCPNCSIGCGVNVLSKGKLLLRCVPADNGFLCEKGRFGYRAYTNASHIDTDEMLKLAEAHLLPAIVRFGSDACALSVADTFTNEDYEKFIKFANDKGIALYGTQRTDSGLEQVLGKDSSTVSLEEALNSDVLVIFGDVKKSHEVAYVHLNTAIERGKKLFYLSKGDINAFVSGSNEAGVAYKSAKKAVIVFAQAELSVSEAAILAKHAQETGHIFKPRSGIIQLKSHCNSQGLCNAGIKGRSELTKAIENGSLKALVSLGQTDGLDVSTLCHLNIDGQNPYLTTGTYTDTFGNVNKK